MMVEAGFITALGVIWLICRVDAKKIAGHSTFWDIAISAFLAFIFIGTFAGMVTGVLAGVLVSLFLTSTRKFAGYKRLTFCRLPGEFVAKPRWVTHNPTFRK
jgi:hypothetical protein